MIAFYPDKADRADRADRTDRTDRAAQRGWHPLKVSLKTGRADVTARPGYYVP